jgi:hypothetical protein
VYHILYIRYRDGCKSVCGKDSFATTYNAPPALVFAKNLTVCGEREAHLCRPGNSFPRGARIRPCLCVHMCEKERRRAWECEEMRVRSRFEQKTKPWERGLKPRLESL